MARAIYDLTVKRAGTRPYGRKIEHCPSCGRKGAVSRYRNGDVKIAHRMREGLFGFREVFDFCMVKASANAATTPTQP